MQVYGVGGHSPRDSIAFEVEGQGVDLRRAVFTVACGAWQEFVLAGLVCVEKGLLGEPPASLDPTLEAARGHTRAFDVVFGIDTSLFAKAHLESWFPHARSAAFELQSLREGYDGIQELGTPGAPGAGQRTARGKR